MFVRGDTVVFEKEMEKIMGLSNRVVPKGTYYVFPHVFPPQRITTAQMVVPIRIYQLSESAEILEAAEVVPGRVLTLRPKTFHVVETAILTPVRTDFQYLRRLLR